MIFYHSRLADEPTGTIDSLWFLWFLNNVANSVEMKVVHEMTPISRTTYNKLLFKIFALYHTDV